MTTRIGVPVSSWKVAALCLMSWNRTRRNPGPPEQVLKPVGDVATVERRADGRGEHEVPFVVPHPGCQPFSDLPDAMLAQCRGRHAWQMDRPTRARSFRLGEHVVRTGAGASLLRVRG